MLPRLAQDSAVCQKQKNCAEDRSNEPCTLAPRIDVEATSKKTRYECTGDANARCDQTPSRIRAGRKHLGNNTDHKPNQQCPKNVHDSFDRNCLDLSTKKTFFGLACIFIFHFTPNAMKDYAATDKTRRTNEGNGPAAPPKDGCDEESAATEARQELRDALSATLV